MILRRATIKDFDRLKKIKADFYLWECGMDKRIRPEWAEKQLQSRLARNLKHHTKSVAFFIAEERGEIIGYSGGEIEKALGFVKSKRLGHMFNLYVKPEYRKKGIGKKLIKEVLAWFKKNKVKELKILVYPHNKPAHEIYKKLGFKDYIIELRK
jgi:ribosomal protein S18 acetylase RimI-like enzyme